MSNVLEVTPKTWNKDGQPVVTYWVTLDDKTDDVPCYDERAKDLKRGPLPDGWEVATSAKGKPYLKAPKQGGKGGGFAQSWYNSEAGVKYTQERMDRRTSLMQAVTLFGMPESEAMLDSVRDFALSLADDFYAWLRASDSPSIGAAEGAPITSAAGGGGTSTDPIPPKGPQETGMGKAQPAEGGGAEVSLDAVLPPIQEPHIFEAGRQLASGSWLCKVCGAKEQEHV